MIGAAQHNYDRLWPLGMGSIGCTVQFQGGNMQFLQDSNDTSFFIVIEQ